MNPKFCYVMGAALWLAVPCFAQSFKLASPDKKTVVAIDNNNLLQYTVSSNGLIIIYPSSQKIFDHDKK